MLWAEAPQAEVAAAVPRVERGEGEHQDQEVAELPAVPVPDPVEPEPAVPHRLRAPPGGFHTGSRTSLPPSCRYRTTGSS